MKKITTKIFAAAGTCLLASACLGDLNTLPLNETDFTSESAYVDEVSYLKGLTYINAYWSFVSQNDPGSSDLDFRDAGQSELCRQYTLLNELSAGSYGCSWGDAYINPIQRHTWTTTDIGATTAVYTRGMKGITLANEFLMQTEADKLAARGQQSLSGVIAGFRAEARFHRAMYYYVLMDLFGNPPFAMPENIGGEKPKQIGRKALFEWIESECLDLLGDGSPMPKKGEVEYPRPTQGSVAALLARMYLNAEVYTGTARWGDAKTYAEKVIDMGYTRHDNYQELFMDDNTTNGAASEFIFAIDYDNVTAQSWGGTTTLCSAAFNDNMAENLLSILGISEETAGTDKAHGDVWNGYHVSDEYVQNFNLQDVSWGGGANTLGYNRETSDKRAFFYNGGQTQDWTDTDNTTGWRCWKWLGIDTKGHIRNSADELGNWKISSADFAIFRLPEMYLIYAEADARLSGGTTTDAKAIGWINDLHDRAGIAHVSSMNLEDLLRERACELMWEGHRRTDLIRYDRFENDRKFMRVYPILTSDINANERLEQNPGY